MILSSNEKSSRTSGALQTQETDVLHSCIHHLVTDTRTHVLWDSWSHTQYMSSYFLDQALEGKKKRNAMLENLY